MSAPVLYHCPQTRGATTLWMNEELGGPCQVRLVDIRAGGHKKAEYLGINPMGKIPALTHDGVTVTEAAAICAYLADAFGGNGLAPSVNDPKRGAYFRWMFFAPGCIEPAMLDKLSNVARENASAAGHGTFDNVVAAAKTALENGPYILGENFTAADVVFGSTLNFAIMFGAFPKDALFVKYIERLTSRSAAKRAQALDQEHANMLGWK